MKPTRQQIKRRRESIRRFYDSLPPMSDFAAQEEHQRSKNDMGSYDDLPQDLRDKRKGQ